MNTKELHPSLATYWAATDAFREGRDAVLELRAQLRYARADVSNIEDTVLVAGGFGAVVIDGKNQEMREAQLHIALSADPHYRAMVAEVARLEDGLAAAEADVDCATNTMRGARLAIEFETSWNYRQAAAEGQPARGEGNGI